MDINFFRSLVTVAGFVCFVSIAIWAWSRPARTRFDEAAMQPINDDDLPKTGASNE